MRFTADDKSLRKRDKDLIARDLGGIWSRFIHDTMKHHTVILRISILATSIYHWRFQTREGKVLVSFYSEAEMKARWNINYAFSCECNMNPEHDWQTLPLPNYQDHIISWYRSIHIQIRFHIGGNAFIQTSCLHLYHTEEARCCPNDKKHFDI